LERGIIMTWRKHFHDHILYRGLIYFQEGRVQHLRSNADRYTAQVKGTKTYDVSFHGDQKSVEDLWCTCPHAQSGENCKHMAAVLYAAFGVQEEDADLDDLSGSGVGYWDDEPDAWEETTAHSDNVTDKDDEGWADRYAEDFFRTHDKAVRKDSRDIQQTAPNDTLVQVPQNVEMAELATLIAQADDAFVRMYLYKALLENIKLQMRFRDALMPPSKVRGLDAYKREYERIFDAYTQFSGDFSYIDDSSDFADDIMNFVNNTLDTLIEKGRQGLALDVMMGLMQRLNRELGYSDAEEGYCYWLLEECGEALTRLVASCTDSDEEEQLFAKSLQAVSRGLLTGEAQSAVENLLFTAFPARKYDARKKDLCHSHIELLDREKRRDSFDMWVWVRRLLNTLHEMGASKQELESFYQTYWDISNVRSYRIDRAIKKRQYDVAINLMEAERQRPDDIAGYTMLNQLKELYLQEGREQDYERLLWEMAASRGGDMEHYHELKQYYSDEDWLAKRERLLSLKAWKYPSYQAAVLSAEGLNERLLEVVLQSDGVNMLKAYEEQLKPLYAEQLLEKYTKEVCRMAARVSDRGTYQSIVCELRRIRRYPGGDAVVQELANRWKEQYKNRRAMMQELDRL
jgi:hypothetical protein